MGYHSCRLPRTLAVVAFQRYGQIAQLQFLWHAQNLPALRVSNEWNAFYSDMQTGQRSCTFTRP